MSHSNAEVVSQCIYMLMRDKEGRKKEASKGKQKNEAKQHSTPEAVTFPKKNACALYIYSLSDS